MGYLIDAMDYKYYIDRTGHPGHFSDWYKDELRQIEQFESDMNEFL